MRLRRRSANLDDITELRQAAASGRPSRAGSAVVRGGALRVAGYLLGVLVSALSAALLFRHLGVVRTGQYVTATSLVVIVASISDLGLTAFGVREMSVRPPEERWTLARDLLGLRLTLSVAGGLAVAMFAWAAYSPDLAYGVALASIGLLFQVAQDNLSLPLLVDLRLGRVAALELLRQVTTTVFIVVLVQLGAGLVPFLGIPMPVGLIGLAVTVLLVRGRPAWLPTFNRRRWRDILAAVLPFSVAFAAVVLYFRVSILLVSALSSPIQLGYFAASYRMVEVLAFVPTLLTGSVLPILAQSARDDEDRFCYALRRLQDSSLILGTWVAAMIWLGAPLAIRVIAGASFTSAVPVLRLQGIGLGVSFLNVAWGYALLSIRRHRTILFLNLFAVGMNVALVAPLASLVGARGAAIGTAAAEIILAVSQALAVTRLRPELRPRGWTIPLVIFAAGCAVVPAQYLLVPVIARLLIASAVYGGLLLVTRTLPPEFLLLLPDRLTPAGLRRPDYE